MIKKETYIYPKLKGKRHELGYTMDDMADRLGISKDCYFNKEKGYRDFNLSEVRKILELFNCSYDEIFLVKVSTK